jgi:hypothetical protein
MRRIAGSLDKGMSQNTKGECRWQSIILKKLYFIPYLSGKVKRWVGADLLNRGYIR